MAKVTVLTPTTGNPLLGRCIESVRNQTHKDVEHLIFLDGQESLRNASDILYQNTFPCGRDENVISLPYPVGSDRWNGHRMYGAGIFLARGDYVIFLDEDNNLDPTHIENCLKVVERGNDWTFSFRKIVDDDNNVLCLDDCESLGIYPSVLHPEDYFVDVGAFFLPRELAVQTCPIWYRKAREDGVPEVDRALTSVLRRIAPHYDSTYKYTLNYRVGSTGISVKEDFFQRGNAEMLRKYNNNLPWKL